VIENTFKTFGIMIDFPGLVICDPFVYDSFIKNHVPESDMVGVNLLQYISENSELWKKMLDDGVMIPIPIKNHRDSIVKIGLDINEEEKSKGRLFTAPVYPLRIESGLVAIADILYVMNWPKQRLSESGLKVSPDFEVSPGCITDFEAGIYSVEITGFSSKDCIIDFPSKHHHITRSMTAGHFMNFHKESKLPVFPHHLIDESTLFDFSVYRD